MGKINFEIQNKAHTTKCKRTENMVGSMECEKCKDNIEYNLEERFVQCIKTMKYVVVKTETAFNKEKKQTYFKCESIFQAQTKKACENYIEKNGLWKLKIMTRKKFEKVLIAQNINK